jgi:hypothetical protein
MLPAATACPSTPEAEAFVRFCYARRRIGWPELYDEMCLVAARGLFHGMGPDALRDVGVGFSLTETPGLAVLVRRIAAEDQAARRAARAAAIDARAFPEPAERWEATASSETAMVGSPAGVA